jgi:RimJ/RimL family protein N-acetyltransferase
MTAYIDVYNPHPGGAGMAPIHPLAAQFLWDCMKEALQEPHTTISHTKMPTWDEHLGWLERRTQRALLMIETSAPYADRSGLVGFVSLTRNNEIGIRIRNGFRGQGHGRRAVEHMLRLYEPLPEVPSVRPGRFVANINPANAASIALFTGLGAKQIQNTYAF